MTITTVLVDDEPYALSEMEYFLEKYPEISIIGKYTDPREAMERIEEAKPQAVFLDINMPQLMGTDAASLILDVSPETDIVFATAYNEYAVEAFELNATDYILKPVNEERLKKTVERLLKRSPLQTEAIGQKLKIECFGGFQMYWEGREAIKWRIDKARELFIYLLQNHNRKISKDELLDALWPEEYPGKAVKLLYNSIYYIRKALKSYGISNTWINLDSGYHLKLGAVEWDVMRFCGLFDEGGGKMPAFEEIRKLYAGEYLQGEFYPWADFERDRLSKLYERYSIELSAKLLEEKDYRGAEELLLKAYDSNPYNEEISELLLTIYNEMGNKANAVKHLREYARLIERELGIKPQKRLQELLEL